MKIQILKWTTIFIITTSILNANDHNSSHIRHEIIDQKVQTSTDDILSSILNGYRIFKREAVELPTDISYLFVDCKYKNGVLKVCELGPSTHAGLTDSHVIINKKKHAMISPYWSSLWLYLNQHHLPIWYVGNVINEERIALNSLFALGGRRVATLDDLTHDELFCSLIQPAQPAHAMLFKDYDGIIVYRRSDPQREPKNYVAAMQSHFSNFLWINKIALKYVKKNTTAKLFSNANLTCFKPKWALFKKKYHPTLAQQISQKIESDLVVIKPLYATQSRGVIIVEQKNLDATLQLILNNHQTIKNTAHRSLSHWKHDQAQSFIVEEFISSKNITIENKKYDPTMRIVFILSHERGTVQLNILGGFWKIPKKSLSDQGTIIEKHVTIPFAGKFFAGIPISQNDMRAVQNILKQILPTLYVQMLKESAVEERLREGSQ